MRPVPHSTITTTLYDLMSALHTQMAAEDDQIITAIVVHLMQTTQIRVNPTGSTHNGWLERHNDDGLDDSSAAFPSQIEPQLAVAIV